eukprot:12307557-Karenia_brevis.AAC.1
MSGKYRSQGSPMWGMGPGRLGNQRMCAQMSVPMSVNVGCRVAPTFGKAMSVPMSYDVGFPGPWALDPGPLRASTGKSCSRFSRYKSCPRYKKGGEYKRG